MKIFVPAKRVLDPDQPIHLNDNGTAVNLDGIPCIINPFDAIAIEEALRIRDEDRAGAGDVEVIVAGIGPPECEKVLRIALAMGVDRAIHVSCDDFIDPWVASNLLKALVDLERPDLVIMGKLAIDDDSNQTGQFLASHLRWPQATFASGIEFEGNRIKVSRETDFGIQTVSMEMPAVVTTDLRLNEPRYASLPAIMKARRKPLEVHTPESLHVPVDPRVEVLSLEKLSAKRNCQRVKSVGELLTRLRTAGVL